MEPINVSYSELKRHLSSGAQLKYVDHGPAYQVFAVDPPFAVMCQLDKTSADASDFESTLKADALIASQVTTQVEKPDKDLVLASAEAAFTGNLCVLSVQIPGTIGDLAARYVAGGYAFTDIYGWNDRVSKIKLMDKNFVYSGLAYPATPTEAGIPSVEGQSWAQVMPDGVEMGSFCDDALDGAFRGWRLWCDDGNQGGMDIDPLGGMGKLPALTFLEITIEKQPASAAAHGAVNIWWGKKNA